MSEDINKILSDFAPGTNVPLSTLVGFKAAAAPYKSPDFYKQIRLQDGVEKNDADMVKIAAKKTRGPLGEAEALVLQYGKHILIDPPKHELTAFFDVLDGLHSSREAGNIPPSP